MSANNTTAADRVEKKSIDEAIASFAMLVRCVLRFDLLFLFLVFQRLLFERVFFHSHGKLGKRRQPFSFSNDDDDFWFFFFFFFSSRARV